MLIKEQYLSKTARILRLLKSKGGASNTELNKICFRYSARIYELRKEGHIIVPVHIKDGLWDFIYKGQKETPPPDEDEDDEPRKEFEDVS